jgi:hypothetical protein
MELTKRRLTPLTLSLVLLLDACGGGGGAGPTTPTRASPPPDANIGPAGGTVTGAGGAVRLVVPAGALTASVGLSVRASSQGPLDPHAVFRMAYEIILSGTAFAVPATLVIPFDPGRGPSGTEEADWRVASLDAGGAWQPVAGTTDTGAHEATAPSVPSTGVFGVVWPGPRDGCGSREDRQFDFWLGSWDYHQGNLPPASNEITKEGGGCLIEEHFQDPAGVQGRSVSLFSRKDGQWHRTYIDSQDTFLALVGGLQGRRMVLNQSANRRFSWDPLDADTVRYFGEQSADGGNTWVVNLDARYIRR